MPAKARELERAAKALGFTKTRQKGSHARWQHRDGRATTLPMHGDSEIGGWLFREILKQLGLTEDQFRKINNSAAIFSRNVLTAWHPLRG